MNYNHLITIEPGKRSGQPCIRGLRMTVQDVLNISHRVCRMPRFLVIFPI